MSPEVEAAARYLRAAVGEFKRLCDAVQRAEDVLRLAEHAQRLSRTRVDAAKLALLEAIDAEPEPPPAQIITVTGAREVTLREEKPQHVCGLSGYDPMRDPMCPACARRRQ